MPATSGGLVDIPVGICLAAIGKALWNQSTNPKGGATTAGSSTTPVLSVPVSVCAAILGQAKRQQKSFTGGLVSVPVTACIVALGITSCSRSVVPIDGSSPPSNPGSVVSIPVSVRAAVLGSAECSQFSL